MDNMVRTRPVQMLPGLDEGSGLVLISVLGFSVFRLVRRPASWRVDLRLIGGLQPYDERAHRFRTAF